MYVGKTALSVAAAYPLKAADVDKFDLPTWNVVME